MALWGLARQIGPWTGLYRLDGLLTGLDCPLIGL